MSEYRTINIGDSDEKADWIKLVDGGRHKRREQRIHERQQHGYKRGRASNSDRGTL